jgi:xylose isomerase
VTQSPRFATRLNSFASGAHLEWPGLQGKPSLMQMATRAAKVTGLTDVDLNYPDHVAEDPAALARRLGDLGLAVNGLAMRYYTNPAFKLGAFTHPDVSVRREAIDLTKRGIDAARAAGTSLMTLWLGQDGFDYAFQADYARMWQDEIDGIREVCDHDPDCLISIEYKPNEPRAYSLMPDCATTLLAISEVGAKNLGVTLDFAHVLYADEQPAFAAALIARRSRLLGVHLNDGYSKRDDGLMVGAVHTLQTIELLRQIRRDGYDGAIYFDTFPDLTGLDPVRECEVNIATVRRMMTVVDRLEADNRLSGAVSRQDAVAAQAIVQDLMFGAG